MLFDRISLLLLLSHVNGIKLSVTRSVCEAPRYINTFCIDFPYFAILNIQYFAVLRISVFCVQLPNTAFGERTAAFGYQTSCSVSERPRSVTKRRVRWANDHVRLPNAVFGDQTTAFGYQTSCSVSKRPRSVTKHPVRWENITFGKQTTMFGERTNALGLQTPPLLLMLIVCPRGRSFTIIMDSSRSGLREIEESLARKVLEGIVRSATGGGRGKCLFCQALNFMITL